MRNSMLIDGNFAVHSGRRLFFLCHVHKQEPVMNDVRREAGDCCNAVHSDD
jgi:hypothetical protein